MIKKWAEDIRTKTENMTRQQKTEYVLTYYWYHILLTALAVGILILCVYHVLSQNQKAAFTVVIVNQKIDYSRDQAVAEEFAAYADIQADRLTIDSDYQISYDGVKLEGINESSFDKFFFNWSAGVLDAIVMPESFFRYCIRQNGEMTELDEWLAKDELERMSSQILEHDGKRQGIYLENTWLASLFTDNPDDRLILVFPSNGKHGDMCGLFLDCMLDRQE